MLSLTSIRSARGRDVAPAFQPSSRCVQAGASLQEVLRAVIDEENPVVGVVTSCGSLLGTISERDILRCLPPSGSPASAAQAYARFLQLRAVDVMSELEPEPDPGDLA